MSKTKGTFDYLDKHPMSKTKGTFDYLDKNPRKKGTFGYLDKDTKKKIEKDGKKKLKLADLKEQLESVKALQPTTNKGKVSKMGATRILTREIERLSAKSSRKNKRKRSGGRKRKGGAGLQNRLDFYNEVDEKNITPDTAKHYLLVNEDNEKKALAQMKHGIPPGDPGGQWADAKPPTPRKTAKKSSRTLLLK